jgi:hypothetical protein
MQGLFNMASEKQTEASVSRVLDLTEQTFGIKYENRVLPKPASEEQKQMLRFLDKIAVE